ncbi:9896_t:CDS:2 [Rhizophagus irregularis]|nr:9896_t:CDS:2 [Rhizophagus irregularis]
MFNSIIKVICASDLFPLVFAKHGRKHDEIKEMHAIYEVQFPLFHAQIMIIGLCYAKRCERREALFNVYRVYRKFRLCWIVLALSTWNTLRCYRNFNNTAYAYAGLF